MNGLFFTAVGTDVGKTYILSNLIHSLQAKQNVRALKPIISGFEYTCDSDTHQLLRAQKEEINPSSVQSISPFRFQAPLSPDQASALEGKSIDLKDVVAFCNQKLSDTKYFWMIEGVGGVMVPLNDKVTVLDWIQALGIPVILVTGSYLGALSHTLTAVKTLVAASVEIRSIVVNQSESCVGLAATIKSLNAFIEGIQIIPWQRGETTCPPDLIHICTEIMHELAGESFDV